LNPELNCVNREQIFGLDISIGLANCGPFAVWANNWFN
jgi:hypothetical protein